MSRKALEERLRRQAEVGPGVTRMAQDLIAMTHDKEGQIRLLAEAWECGIASWGCGSVTITVRSDHIKAELDQLGDA